MVTKEKYDTMSHESKYFFVTKKVQILAQLEKEIENFTPSEINLDCWQDVLQEKKNEYERRKLSLMAVL